MWQRKQTLFFLGSLIMVCLCLYLPLLGVDGGTSLSTVFLYNLGWVGSDEGFLVGWPLFAFISLTGVLSTVAVFCYKNRRLQMRLATAGMIFNLLWYVYYIIMYCQMSADATHVLHLQLGAVFPLLSLIFLWLARRGVKADEKLVRSMDRIR